MKNPKMENIHHFAHEFAFEDLKDKTGVDRAHHSKPHRTIDGQFAQMKKQIARSQLLMRFLVKQKV